MRSAQAIDDTARPLDAMSRRVESRIIFVTVGVPGLGAPHHFMPAIWLKARGFDVTCLVPSDSSDGIISTPVANIPCRTFGRGRGVLSKVVAQARLAGMISRFVRQNPRSLVYVGGSSVSPGAYLGTRLIDRRRVIYHTQDFLEPGKHRQWEYFEKRLARSAGQVISNEINRARFMASHYRLNSIPVVVPTALPGAWPKPLYDSELRARLARQMGAADAKGMRLIISQGGYDPLRAGGYLLDALALLSARHCLVFTAMDEKHKHYAVFRAHVERLKLAGRVLALPMLGYEEMMRYTASCDVGVLLYPNDGVGNFYQAPGRLTQYLGCGLPVIASNFPGLELLVLKHNLGAVSDPASAREIAGSIESLTNIAPEAEAGRRTRLRRLAATTLAYDAQAFRTEEAVERALAAC